MKRRAFFKAMGLVGLTPFIAKGDASWEDDWEDLHDEEWTPYDAPLVAVSTTRFYAGFKTAVFFSKRVLEGPYYVQLVGPGYEFNINHSTTADISDRILGPRLLDVSVIERDGNISVDVKDDLVFRFPPGYEGLLSHAILSKPSGDLALCITLNQRLASSARSEGDTVTLAWSQPLVLLS